MGQDDLVIASTSDTADEMRTALVHGIEPPEDTAILSTIDDEPAEPVKTEATEPETPDEAEEVPVEKPAAKKTEKPSDKPEEKHAPKAKAEAPKRTDFEDDDTYLEAAANFKAQKRIAKLTYEREEEKRQRLAAEGRVAELSKPKPAAAKVEEKPVVEAKPEPVAPKPKADDYATHEEWLEALSAWNAETVTKKAVDAALAAERAKNEEKEQAAAIAAQQEVYANSKTDAQARYEDFDAVIAAAAEMPVTGVMNYVMLKSPIGHDIAYYLASHRDEATRIYELPGPDQIEAMGELAGTLKAQIAALDVQTDDQEVEIEEVDEDTGEPKPKPKPRAVTKTPDPINPVGGRKTPGQMRDEDMSTRDWIEKRNREEAAKKKFRR